MSYRTARRKPSMLPVLIVGMVVIGCVGIPAAGGFIYFFLNWEQQSAETKGTVGQVSEKGKGGNQGGTAMQWERLTDDERIRWEKYRREFNQRYPDKLKELKSQVVPDKDHIQVIETHIRNKENFQVLGYEETYKSWSAWSLHLNDINFTARKTWNTGLPSNNVRQVSNVDSLLFGMSQKEAIDDATAEAANKNIRCTVVVDLYTASQPQLITWFYDDGSGVKRFSTAPSPEMLAGLREYVHKLQANPQIHP